MVRQASPLGGLRAGSEFTEGLIVSDWVLSSL